MRPASEFSGIDVVRPDNASAARMATEYLIKNGHRQIAYFGGESDSLTRAERVGGYCSTLVQYGLPFRTEWIVETDNKQQNIIRRVSEFMYQYPKVSAIVCHNTGTALGAYFAALSTGNTVRQGITKVISLRKSPWWGLMISAVKHCMTSWWPLSPSRRGMWDAALRHVCCGVLAVITLRLQA